jgi:heat shock protein HslJ
VHNARTVYFYQQGDDWQNNEVAPQGQQTLYPERTATYALRVVKQDGSEEVRTLTVAVLAGTGAQIEFFAVVPNDRVPFGTCVEITWRVSGDAPTLLLSADEDELWAQAPLEGSLQDCPPAAGVRTYTLQAADAAGSDTRQQVVTVDETTARTAPQETPAAPLIDTFAVVPTEIALNECVAVTWNVGGDVRSLDILRDENVVLDEAPFTGSGQNCLTAAGSYRYQLVATSSEGISATAEVTVTVQAAVTPAQPARTARAGDPALLGQLWLLNTLIDSAGTEGTLLANSQITAEFDEAGTLAGSAGCNRYQASYSANQGTLTVDPALSTRKFCVEPEGLMDQETHYLAALRTVTAYAVENDQLTLLNGLGQPVARYQTAP